MTSSTANRPKGPSFTRRRIAAALAAAFVPDSWAADGPSRARPTAELVSPEDFGAVGDGLHDDTSAMMAMGEHGRTSGSLHIRLKPGRTYTYTNPLFLTGIKDSLIIDGEGAAFQNIRATVHGPHATFANNEGLVFYPAFFGLGRTLIGTVSPQHYFGELINDVEAGESTIALSSGAGVTGFAEGERVMVYGFSIEVGGFPSNALYFEYATVKRIVGNAITIDRPLKYGYRKNWPNLNPTAVFTGAPRLLPLRHHSAQEMAYLEINGLRLKACPGWSSAAGGTINRNGRLSVGNYRQCVLNGVQGEGGMYVFQGQSFVDNGSRFHGEVEIDKYIERAELRGVDYASVSQGTGCRVVRFSGGFTIRSANATDALETFELDDGRVLSGGAGGALLPGTFGTPRFLMRNVTFNVAASHKYVKSDTRIAVAFESVTSTRLDMPWSAYSGTNIHRVLRPGTVVYNAKGQAVFKVTHAPVEAAGRVYVDGTRAGGSFVSGDTLFCSIYPFVQEEGCKYLLAGAKTYLPVVANPFVGPLLALRLDSRAGDQSWWDGGPRRLTSAAHYLQLGNEVQVSGITIAVERAYTGATKAAVLRIRRLGESRSIALVDLKSTGKRTLTPTEGFGAKPGDNLSGLGAAPMASVEYSTTADVEYASDDEAPIFSITVEGRRVLR